MAKHLIIRLAFTLFILSASSVESSAYYIETVRSYIRRHKDIALLNEKKYGVPATIALAHGILESHAGTSELTRRANNHFGIKAGKNWTGKVYSAWDDEPGKSKFKFYDSAEESFNDFAKQLTNMACYKELLTLSVYDYRSWAYGLKKSGYASSQHYAQALIGIIDQYRLYEINGGVKLKAGKTVSITQYIEVDKPIFNEEYTLDDNVESEEQTMLVNISKRDTAELNGVPCVVIQLGETATTIVRNYGVSLANLLEYNEISSEYQINEGDIVFIAKKKKKYEGAQDVYVTKAGETLHYVSQKFGIQLNQLAKINKINDSMRLEEGMRIYLK